MARMLLAWFAYGVIAVLAVVVTTNTVIYTVSSPYTFTSIDRVPAAQVALIPGAPVFETGVLTPIFTDRVEKARALYLAGKVDKILVSGDNSTLEHDEVNPVRNYLIAMDIPAQDIFLDHAGFDTYQSMYRAKAIFGVESMLIVSQSFHLPRALFIARNLGIEAHGVTADTGPVLARNYVRELFADQKAVFELLFEVKPRYLGPPIPIDGDGTRYQ